MTEPKNYGDALAVVTVTYSPGETLTRFLDTLEKATERDVQVVLADNGSVDGAPERAAAERDNVRFVPTGGNLGYGGGANAGVAVAIPNATSSPVEGSATLTDAQAADLMAGKYYINVHTAANPAGEIRGQVTK